MSKEIETTIGTFMNDLKISNKKRELVERRSSWPFTEFETKATRAHCYKSFLKEQRKSREYPLHVQSGPSKDFPIHVTSCAASIPPLLRIMKRRHEAACKTESFVLKERIERIRKANLQCYVKSCVKNFSEAQKTKLGRTFPSGDSGIGSERSTFSDDESEDLRRHLDCRMLPDEPIPMVQDFREFLEHLVPLPEILHICVVKTLEDTQNVCQLPSFECFLGMITPLLSIAFRNKCENWLPIRNRCAAILKRNSHALHYMMKYAFQARLIASSTCFIASLGAFWLKNRAFHWTKYFTLTSSIISYLGIISYLLIKAMSRRLLDEAVDVIVYEEHEYQSIIYSLYMNGKVYKKIQDLSQFIDINWINVQYIRNYFERERKEHPWSKFLLLFNIWPDDINDCSKLYFTLLLTAAANDRNVLREKSACKKLFSFCFSSEGIAFWRCMNLEDRSTFYTRVILRLHPFPKRHTIFSLPFPALPFWLYSTHPAALAGKLIFYAASAFDAFRNLRKGIGSEQISRMLELSHRLKEEEEELKRIFYQSERNFDISSLLMP